MSKFKVGDIISYQPKGPYHKEIKDRRFRIVELCADNRHACESLEAFDGHECYGAVPSGRGWWIDEREMVLAPDPNAVVNGYIVCQTQNGKLLPSSEPFIHDNFSDASREAIRLSEKYGQRFTVLATSYTCLVKVEKHVTDLYL